MNYTLQFSSIQQINGFTDRSVNVLQLACCPNELTTLVSCTVGTFSHRKHRSHRQPCHLAGGTCMLIPWSYFGPSLEVPCVSDVTLPNLHVTNGLTLNCTM